jgi:hypothetical protein
MSNNLFSFYLKQIFCFFLISCLRQAQYLMYFFFNNRKKKYWKLIFKEYREWNKKFVPFFLIEKIVGKVKKIMFFY